MRVWQPGGHLMAERSSKVDDWSWRRTRRRLATLARLTAPYKTRTILSVFALLACSSGRVKPFGSHTLIEPAVISSRSSRISPGGMSASRGTTRIV